MILRAAVTTARPAAIATAVSVPDIAHGPEHNGSHESPAISRYRVEAEKNFRRFHDSPSTPRHHSFPRESLILNSTHDSVAGSIAHAPYLPLICPADPPDRLMPARASTPAAKRALDVLTLS